MSWQAIVIGLGIYALAFAANSCSKPEARTPVESKLSIEILGDIESDSCFSDARMYKVTTQDNQVFYILNDCHGSIMSR